MCTIRRRPYLISVLYSTKCLKETEFKGCDSNLAVETFKFEKSLQMKQLPCIKQYNYTSLALKNYNNNDQEFNRHDFR